MAFQGFLVLCEEVTPKFVWKDTVLWFMPQWHSRVVLLVGFPCEGSPEPVAFWRVSVPWLYWWPSWHHSLFSC